MSFQVIQIKKKTGGSNKQEVEIGQNIQACPFFFLFWFKN